jgi:hypothetical protein
MNECRSAVIWFIMRYSTTAHGRRPRCAKGEVSDREPGHVRRRGTGSELRRRTTPLHSATSLYFDASGFIRSPRVVILCREVNIINKESKKKCIVVPLPWKRIHCLVKHNVMNTNWGNDSTAPQILNLNTSWRWVVSFTPQLLYPRYPLNRRLSRMMYVLNKFIIHVIFK